MPALGSSTLQLSLSGLRCHYVFQRMCPLSELIASASIPNVPNCNRAFELTTYKAVKDASLPENIWGGVKMDLWARLIKFGSLEEVATR